MTLPSLSLCGVQIRTHTHNTRMAFRKHGVGGGLHLSGQGAKPESANPRMRAREEYKRGPQVVHLVTFSKHVLAAVACVRVCALSACSSSSGGDPCCRYLDNLFISLSLSPPVRRTRGVVRVCAFWRICLVG